MITPTSFNVFISNVQTAVGAVYEDKTDSIWPQYATQVPVTGSVYVEGWTGMIPKMRVWYGSRVTQQAAPQTYSAIPRPYELTLDIDKFHLDDDLFGIYYRQIPDIARQVARWPNYELRDLLENTGAYTGPAQLGFDGLSYFNTAHPVDLYNSSLGTYCNDFSGGGQTVTYPKNISPFTQTVPVGGAFGPTAFATLYEYMSTLRGEDGERLGIQPSVLMHPPQLKTEVELVLKNMMFAPPAWGTITGQVGAADNVFRRFGVMPVENIFLNDSSMWYMLDGTRAFKPVTWAVREPVKIVPRMSDNDPSVFDTHTYLIGASGRATSAWGFSFLMARSGP